MRRYSGLVLVAAFGLTGCSEFRDLWTDRYGPDPTLGIKTNVVARENVSEAVLRENGVVRALLEGNGFGKENMPRSVPEWYSVILTGFNTVDDACQIYISDLWKFDRQKNRIKDIITASGAATAAIVGANTNASPATLTTLAQAFGLGSALTGSIGDSYLFAQDPATIGKLVKKLQVAYRNDLAKAIVDPKAVAYPINSPAAVYYHTREYLSLCLPPTIQGQIQDALAKTTAAPDPTSGSPQPKKTLGVAPTAKATSNVTLQ